MAFERYWAEKAAYDAANKPEMVKIILNNSPAFNKNVLLASIYDIPNMNELDLRRFVQNSYKLILNNIFFGSPESNDYIACFTNIRFLNAFYDVIANIQYLGSDDVVKINTICYHYITSTNKDPMVENGLIRIALYVNRSITPRLLGLGLSNNLAAMIVIARYSDLNIAICVKRVNFIIITQPQELMTDNMIESVFHILYNIEMEYDKVFSCIMLDVVPDYYENDPSTHWVTDEIQNVDSALSLASLNILENMSFSNIRMVVLNYSEGYNLVHSNKPTRFSLRKLSDDYSRINTVVDRLINDEGIYVP